MINISFEKAHVYIFLLHCHLFKEWILGLNSRGGFRDVCIYLLLVQIEQTCLSRIVTNVIEWRVTVMVG